MPSVERREICTFQPYRTDRERAQWIRILSAGGTNRRLLPAERQSRSEPSALNVVGMAT